MRIIKKMFPIFFFSLFIFFIYSQVVVAGDIPVYIPAPVCGDGVCGVGESYATCPQDCPIHPGTVFKGTGYATYTVLSSVCGNRICEGDETCKNCDDCECSIGEACCSDGRCCDNEGCCDDGSCNPEFVCISDCDDDGTCEQGEGCTCSDCYNSHQKDACKDDLICDISTQECQCPNDKPYWNELLQMCGPNELCGNDIPDEGENCFNCNYDVGCKNGTRCCQDGQNYICKYTKDDSCIGECDFNGICDRNETYFEACDCVDCLGKEDRCRYGLICSEDYFCGCKDFVSDGVCPNDPDCQEIDPDCSVCDGLPCNCNEICESSETQRNCPTDCKTVITVSPSRLYPGNKVVVTVYFNDSRYKMGKNAKVSLYIDNREWIECVVHDSKWIEDLNWNNVTDVWTGTVNKIINQNTRISNVEIKSIDNYAGIKFDCVVPSDLPVGMYTLKAIPSIYSIEKKLTSAETEIIVEDNSLKLLKFILVSIKVIF